MDKNSIMFADGIAFMCFYDAELVLSAITKFLVYLLGERDAWSEMGLRRGGRKKRVGRERGGYEGARNGKCTKK